MKHLLLIRDSYFDGENNLDIQVIDVFTDDVSESEIGTTIKNKILSHIFLDVKNVCHECGVVISECDSVENIDRQISNRRWNFTHYDNPNVFLQQWVLQYYLGDTMSWGLALTDANGRCKYHL